MLVELVYEKACPNVEVARTQLSRAFARAGIKPDWKEWEVNAPDAPAYVQDYGSPTILVNGQDVSDEVMINNKNCCRVYSHEGSNRYAPTVADIVQALQSAQKVHK